MTAPRLRTAGRLAALAALAVLALPQAGLAATVTGNVRGDATKVYLFTADDFGQVLMTLTWAKSNADLFMLVIDDDDDPLTWCIAAATQNRTQRCEFGAFGGTTYAIGVSTFAGGSKFQLNVQSSGSEFVSGPRLGDALREVPATDPRHRRVVERMERIGVGRR